MALLRRSKDPAKPKKKGRLRQLVEVFTMTRSSDPAVVWWMLLALVGTLAVGLLVGLLVGAPVYVLLLALPIAILLALFVLARRAEGAAYRTIEGRPGATGAVLRNLRRGWAVEEQPVAVDPRTQDLVFRAVGRPGVLLVTEGPLPRVTRLSDGERKRITRVLGTTVPVLVVHAGGGEGQVPLRKLNRTVMRKRPAMTKTEVSEVAKRLRALGGVRVPVPKGIDPMRMRPDRRATRGR